MQNFIKKKNGDFTVDGEDFTEDELCEKLGFTVFDMVNTTLEAREKRIKDIAKRLYNSAKKKHRDVQIAELLKRNPDIVEGFEPFTKSLDDYSV